MEIEENDKVIADPIHGMMTFEPDLMKIINHQYFQRLRHIKQLQGVEHVYPGGVHSRFSHSLGMCYLAGKVLDKLSTETKDTDYKITDLDRKCVTISALCRDIGHGPFSYLYESLGKEFFSSENEHITRGVQITKKIIDEVQLFGNETKNAKKIIENMLQGKKVEHMEDEERKKAFLYQIVRNEDNGVDVNRWDYICRDSHACGFLSNFDISRAVSGLRVVPYEWGDKKANVLAFPDKDQINLYNMFNLRYTLYSKVYYHSVVRCAEEMIADVFKLVDEIKILKRNTLSTKECRIPDALKDFCLMDDKLLYLIYHADDDSAKHTYAKDIIDRIHNRDFYFCIYDRPLDSSREAARIDFNKSEKDLEDKIVNYLEKEENTENKRAMIEKLQKKIETLKEERKGKGESFKGLFRFSIAKVDYGKKTENPIKDVYFYRKGRDYALKDESPKSSPMVPQCFEEVTLRVICTLSKNDCNGLKEEIQSEIKSFCEELINQK